MLPKLMIEFKPTSMNRRAWPREPASLAVRLEHVNRGTFHTGHTVNIGHGGALIAVHENALFAPDDNIRIAFSSDEGPIIYTNEMTSAVVRRVETSEPDTPGEDPCKITIALQYVLC